MKIVVIDGTGYIGSKLVKKLSEHRQEVVAASPSSGVNTLTGEGLSDALKGASVVVRCNELPFMGGRGSAEILRDINPQPPRL